MASAKTHPARAVAASLSALIALLRAWSLDEAFTTQYLSAASSASCRVFRRATTGAPMKFAGSAIFNIQEIGLGVIRSVNGMVTHRGPTLRG